MLFRKILRIKTRSSECVDITSEIKKVVNGCAFPEGICNIFLKATTAGLMINENDLLLKQDFIKFFKWSVPEEKMYTHPENAFSHIRASMLSQDLTIPVSNNELVLGIWQSILLWNFDVADREREIVITISD